MSQNLAERGEATADFQPGIGGGGRADNKITFRLGVVWLNGHQGPKCIIFIYIDHIFL